MPRSGERGRHIKTNTFKERKRKKGGERSEFDGPLIKTGEKEGKRRSLDKTQQQLGRGKRAPGVKQGFPIKDSQNTGGEDRATEGPREFVPGGCTGVKKVTPKKERSA